MPARHRTLAIEPWRGHLLLLSGYDITEDGDGAPTPLAVAPPPMQEEWNRLVRAVCSLGGICPGCVFVKASRDPWFLMDGQHLGGVECVWSGGASQWSSHLRPPVPAEISVLIAQLFLNINLSITQLCVMSECVWTLTEEVVICIRKDVPILFLWSSLSYGYSSEAALCHMSYSYPLGISCHYIKLPAHNSTSQLFPVLNMSRRHLCSQIISPLWLRVNAEPESEAVAVKPCGMCHNWDQIQCWSFRMHWILGELCGRNSPVAAA